MSQFDASVIESLRPEEIVKQCLSSKVGKKLPKALYIHSSAVSSLPEKLRQYEAIAHQILSQKGFRDYSFTLVKFHFDKPGVSFLDYPNFDEDPHPALSSSLFIDLSSQKIQYLDYRDRPNPPILHRRETFIAPTHPSYQTFATLTAQQEYLGLLNESRGIGTRQAWAKKLAQHRIEIINHVLACPLKLERSEVSASKIDRHRAALVRHELSKPVRLALEAQLFDENATFFDYGCGHGSDMRFIARKGYHSTGWDPYYQPQTEKISADVVNLGYIINVIEDTAERRDALIQAWNLTEQVLIVSAQVMISDPGNGWLAYGDGVITSRNTFQKYYEQDELKNYIDQVLGVDSIPTALGIFFVFRDETQAQTFRASKFRSRAKTPRIRLSVKRFEEYQALLKPLMKFFTERGRLPKPQELDTDVLGALENTFGSIKRAFRIILQATDISEWDAIADKRRNDLLVFIALTHFEHRRPRFSQLSSTVQNDIKCLFGSYQQACTAADLMLMSVGNLDMMLERSAQSAIGIKFKQSLLVHHTALDQLDPLLRLYEGCASRTIGRPDEATVIKFHFGKPQISYLTYEHFDQNPHPPLKAAMKIDLRDLQVQYATFHPDENAPLLSQKDKLVCPDYPLHDKFLKLTLQENAWGLLDDPKQFTHQYQWKKCLVDHCAELKGHRLVWKKDADPTQLKFLKAQARSRQRRLNAPSP